ncbi:methyltransferase [Thauera humireducens]|uniref:Methylase n=1 Tax=Thauera humireducens TaxID=1134435 RepID=A0A127K5J2_9RHOO|nr:class I SAM-dependent methyltransferase [Thauera humireducens]AMO37215.1 methylase [Thauera humireducens]
MSEQPQLHWTEGDTPHGAAWRSENGQPAPRRVVVADDTMTADAAWRLACEGTALLWRGDYHNARQLLQAMARRADRRPKKGADKARPFAESFHLHRMAQAQRARTLGMLLIPVEAGGRIALRRAPEVREALAEAFGDEHAALLQAPFVLALRELLGLIGAHEWRRKGVMVPALGDRIHPWYGVFSPIRGEYLDLIARAPLPSTARAFDIGAGTGVIAALLARRGVQQVVATDLSPRALGCARDNLARLGLDARVEVTEADLFPPGRAPLVVCNPPWVPAKPTAAVEQAVYDPDSRMLRGFLSGLAAHLEEGGEGWLILSDLAEHLGLRSRDELLGWIEAAGLKVLGRDDIRPRHGKAADETDPLYKARAAEITSLWRLGVRGA